MHDMLRDTIIKKERETPIVQNPCEMPKKTTKNERKPYVDQDTNSTPHDN